MTVWPLIFDFAIWISMDIVYLLPIQASSIPACYGAFEHSFEHSFEHCWLHWLAALAGWIDLINSSTLAGWEL